MGLWLGSQGRLGFWKTQSNRARLALHQASSLSFLTVQRGCEDPHFTVEKTEKVKFVAKVTQPRRRIQPRSDGVHGPWSLGVWAGRSARGQFISMLCF